MNLVTDKTDKCPSKKHFFFDSGTHKM